MSFSLPPVVFSSLGSLRRRIFRAPREFANVREESPKAFEIRRLAIREENRFFCADAA
jgi:hypothetical protein